MSIVDNERPPYVTFERRAVEDRAASIANGRYTTKDIDLAISMRPGARDTLEKEAEVWIRELYDRARAGLIPQTWPVAVEQAYQAWKKGEALPETGTPIKTWPVVSPSAAKDLIAAGITTVEALAELPDNLTHSIGTGAVALKQKAIAWLKASNDTGKVVEQMAAMSTQLQQLAELTKAQADEIKKLRAMIPEEEKPAKTKAVI